MTACGLAWSEMALADNRYSRFVQLAKVILPLLALGLLSTMFLFSRSVDIDGQIPISDLDIEQIAREQRLAAPTFSGVTSDGSTVSVRAETAKPDLTDPRRMTAVNVMADIMTTNGTQIFVISDDAVYDGNSDMLDLMGRVRINTSTGYELKTDVLKADLEETGLIAPGEVTGFAPAGTLRAGSMVMTSVDGSQVLVFKGGVKLVYDPQD